MEIWDLASVSFLDWRFRAVLLSWWRIVVFGAAAFAEKASISRKCRLFVSIFSFFLFWLLILVWILCFWTRFISLLTILAVGGNVWIACTLANFWRILFWWRLNLLLFFCWLQKSIIRLNLLRNGVLKTSNHQRIIILFTTSQLVNLTQSCTRQLDSRWDRWTSVFLIVQFPSSSVREVSHWAKEIWSFLLTTVSLLRRKVFMHSFNDGCRATLYSRIYQGIDGLFLLCGFSLNLLLQFWNC